MFNLNFKKNCYINRFFNSFFFYSLKSVHFLFVCFMVFSHYDSICIISGAETLLVVLVRLWLIFWAFLWSSIIRHFVPTRIFIIHLQYSVYLVYLVACISIIIYRKPKTKPYKKYLNFSNRTFQKSKTSTHA